MPATPATIAIRPFIGAKDFDTSRAFYADLGFTEKPITHNMTLFELNDLNFYLQDYYSKDWVENTMLFIQVENASTWFEYLSALNLVDKYPGVKLIPVRKEYWGEECMVLDPAGVLLHFGHFYN